MKFYNDHSIRQNIPFTYKSGLTIAFFMNQILLTRILSYPFLVLLYGIFLQIFQSYKFHVDIYMCRTWSSSFSMHALCKRSEKVNIVRS